MWFRIFVNWIKSKIHAKHKITHENDIWHESQKFEGIPMGIGKVK